MVNCNAINETEVAPVIILYYYYYYCYTLFQSSWHSTSRRTKKEMDNRQYWRRLRWHGYNDHWSDAMDSKQITVEMYHQHYGPPIRALTSSSSQRPYFSLGGVATRSKTYRFPVNTALQILYRFLWVSLSNWPKLI